MIRGSCSGELDYPIERCWEVVADLEHAPAWQRTLASVEVLERDQAGRAMICETVTDAKLRQVRVQIRVEYEPPTRLHFTQVSSDDLDDMEGGWELVAIGPDRTRATYSLGVDPGPIGFLARPLERAIKPLVMGHQAEELARALDAG